MKNFIFRPHLSHIYLISNLFFHPERNIGFLFLRIEQLLAEGEVDDFSKSWDELGKKEIK